MCLYTHWNDERKRRERGTSDNLEERQVLRENGGSNVWFGDYRSLEVFLEMAKMTRKWIEVLLYFY